MKQRPDDGRLTARLTMAAVIGLLLLLPPLLSAFNSGGKVFGIPVIGVYLFVAWAAIILLVALLVRGSG
jgi:hypothetical protein